MFHKKSKSFSISLMLVLVCALFALSACSHGSSSVKTEAMEKSMGKCGAEAKCNEGKCGEAKMCDKAECDGSSSCCSDEKANDKCGGEMDSSKCKTGKCGH